MGSRNAKTILQIPGVQMIGVCDLYQGRLDRINNEPDPLRSYLRAMAEAPMNQRGGLGLARVRFEAQLELSITREGNRITVLAWGRLRAPLLQVPGGTHV